MLLRQFSQSLLLCCVNITSPKIPEKYHVSKNTRGKCKTCGKVKDLKSKDGKKKVKFQDVCKTFMGAFMGAKEAIALTDTDEVVVDNCHLFKIVCTNFPILLKYVKTTILRPMNEKVVKY